MVITLALSVALVLVIGLFLRERAAYRQAIRRLNALESEYIIALNPSLPNCRCQLLPVESTRVTRDVLLESIGLKHTCLEDGWIEVKKFDIRHFEGLPLDLCGYFDSFERPENPTAIYLRRK